MQIKRFRFNKAINFRDMGGVFSENGKLVGWNRLYRSDKFNGTMSEEWDLMRRVGINIILDIRSGDEVKTSPDNCPEDFRYIHLPLVEENLSFFNISSPDMQAFAKSVEDGYKNMVIAHGDKIAEIVNAIADLTEEGAVVFHCTSGKDRTGIVAAVIYRLLGVCTEDIVADYQTSYTYNKKASDKFMNEHPQFRQYRNVVLSEEENMYAVLNLFDELDLESYLISKGANKEKLEKLRRNMLVEL